MRLSEYQMETFLALKTIHEQGPECARLLEECKASFPHIGDDEWSSPNCGWSTDWKLSVKAFINDASFEEACGPDSNLHADMKDKQVTIQLSRKVIEPRTLGALTIQAEVNYRHYLSDADVETLRNLGKIHVEYRGYESASVVCRI